MGGSRKRRLHARQAVWLYIGLVLLVLYIPLVPPLLFSIGAAGAGNNALSLAGYAQMWSSPLLTGAVRVTVLAGVIVAVVTPLLGLLAAMAVRELRLRRLVLMLVLLPLFVPGVSMGLATAFFFRQLGIAPSLLTIVIVQVLWALPFATLIVLTVMAGFDPVYVEAAYMSGAGRLRAFLDVELPVIRSGILGAASFSLILSFNETIRTSLVQGPLNTVQTYIWSAYKQVGLSPALYALMSVLVLLTLGLVAVSLATERTQSPQA